MTNKKRTLIKPYEPLDSTFTEFLNAQKKSTKSTYTTALTMWLNWSRLNGKATLDLKKNDSDAKTEKKVLEFNKYLRSVRSENTAKSWTGGIRSFYSNHRMPLKFISGEKKKLQEGSRVTEDYQFTKEDFAKMVQQANLNERYIVLFGKSVGLRASDFLEFTYGDFRAINLDSEPPISLGQRKTKKEHVPAFPFLDSDSVPILKAILERNPNAKNKDKILDWDEESLTQSLQRLSEKAHLEDGGKLVRFHNLRKYLFDKLSCVMSSEKAKQIVGKKISESAYLSTESLRECYARAMPSIVISGNGVNHVKVEQLENALVESQKKISALETTNEVLRAKLEDTSKTMQKVLDLPTIKREMFKAKEKVEM